MPRQLQSSLLLAVACVYFSFIHSCLGCLCTFTEFDYFYYKSNWNKQPVMREAVWLFVVASSVVFDGRVVLQCGLSSPRRRDERRGHRWGVTCPHASLQARSHCLAAISLANICM